MNLREQEYVLAIANYQTLKGAAEFLNVSPPTLSVFLSTLEHTLGVPLFNRFGKKFVPTEVGETYIRYAREMCFLNRQWEARLYDIKHGERGVLRLGLHPRRTTYLLPAALRELTIRHPSIDVKLYEGSSEELFHLLLDGEVDLIINNRPNPAPVLEFIPFTGTGWWRCYRLCIRWLAKQFLFPVVLCLGSTCPCLQGKPLFYSSRTSLRGCIPIRHWTMRGYIRCTIIRWKIWSPLPKWRQRGWVWRSIS